MPPFQRFPLRLQATAVDLVRTSILAAALAHGILAHAQQPPGDPESTSWSLGAAVVSMQKPYIGMDRETKVLPMLRFENRYVRIFGPQIGLKLPGVDIGDSQKLNFSLIGKFDGSGYKAKDAPIFTGMSERKGGFWAGAEMEWKNDFADLQVSWMTDASNKSKGQKFSIGLQKAWRVGQSVMLMPRVEAVWHDKKYVDYYYGVRASEARAGRPAYAGKAGTSAELGLRSVYMIDQRNSVFLDVSVSSLPKSIKDSPLVNRSTESRMLLGYTYRF